MGTFNRFEDLPVWETARGLAYRIYQISGQGSFSRDYGLRGQIQRAAISVMSNIAEGFEHETQALFISYLGRAKASAAEVRSQLIIAADLGYLTSAEYQELASIAENCSKQLFGLIRYLRTLPNSRRTR